MLSSIRIIDECTGTAPYVSMKFYLIVSDDCERIKIGVICGLECIWYDTVLAGIVLSLSILISIILYNQS